jgi:hypothetical protein
MDITIEGLTATLRRDLAPLTILGDDATMNFWVKHPGDLHAPDTVAVAREGDEIVGWSGVGLTRGRDQRPVLGVAIRPSDHGTPVVRLLVTTLLAQYRDQYHESHDYHDTGYMFYPSEYPQLKELIERAGYQAHPLEDSEELPTDRAVVAAAKLSPKLVQFFHDHPSAKEAVALNNEEVVNLLNEWESEILEAPHQAELILTGDYYGATTPEWRPLVQQLGALLGWDTSLDDEDGYGEEGEDGYGEDEDGED